MFVQVEMFEVSQKKKGVEMFEEEEKKTSLIFFG